MIKVYHATNTRSIRVIWLLEELGIPYEIEKLSFAEPKIKSAAYLAIHPLGQVPAIDEDGFCMTESGAIVEYILAKYGKGRLMPKPGTHDHGTCLRWMHFAEATFMPALAAIAQHTFLRPEDQRIPQIVTEAKATAAAMLGVIDKQLAGKKFILGTEFSAADIMLGYNLHLCKLFHLPLDGFPNVAAYHAHLSERPGYKIATAG